MSDEGSCSDLAFGLLELLGISYRPALADRPDQKGWRVRGDADYGPLNTFARGTGLRQPSAYQESLLTFSPNTKTQVTAPTAKAAKSVVLRCRAVGGMLRRLRRAEAPTGSPITYSLNDRVVPAARLFGRAADEACAVASRKTSPTRSSGWFPTTPATSPADAARRSLLHE